MSYEPTNWKTGDVVTSAKLNKLEEGVAAGDGMVATITIDTENISVSKTYDELVSAWENGVAVHGIITPHGASELYAMDFKPVFGFEMYTALKDELDYWRIKYDANTNKWVSENYSYSMTPYEG